MRAITIAQAATNLRAGTTTSVALVQAALDAIDAHNSETNAFTVVHRDRALAAAATADDERRHGIDRGPLHGVPISLKDLIDVAGDVTSAGSRVLNDRIATTDAPVASRLHAAGAVVIGRTNLHEFALGTTSEDSAFGAVRNPRDLTRSAGGSSGGSAAAVATGMGLASIGTDTGGSIRIPAAACGTVGLKPSIDDVPTTGIIPLSTSLDHAGPLTRTVEDTAIVWAVLADRRLHPVDSMKPARLCLGRLDDYFGWLQPAVREAFDRAVAALASAGVRIETREIAGADRIVSTYVNIVMPEGAAWHAPYLETRAGDYSKTVHERLVAARDIRAVDYVAALEARATLRGAVDAALADCDALILPTLPIVAPPIGGTNTTLMRLDRADPITLPIRSAMLRQTQLFNLTGHPAISLPLAVDGLPVGLQVVGRLAETARLLAVAATCEMIVCRHL